jgi:hypothetical protein
MRLLLLACVLACVTPTPAAAYVCPIAGPCLGQGDWPSPLLKPDPRKRREHIIIVKPENEPTEKGEKIR